LAILISYLAVASAQNTMRVAGSFTSLWRASFATAGVAVLLFKKMFY